MAYLRPNGFERNVFSKIAMKFGIGGSETLAIRGRQSGEMKAIPVVPVEFEGARYIVSTRGEAHWVKNLRAAGGQAELKGKGEAKQVTLTEVPVEERSQILEAYRKVAGGVVGRYFKALPEASDHPVFRVEAQ